MSSMIQTDTSSVVRAKKAGAEQYNRRADGTPRPWYSTAIARVVMIALSLLFLLPLYWMIASALKSDEELAQFPPTLIPRSWEFGNFVEAVTAITLYDLILERSASPWN